MFNQLSRRVLMTAALAALLLAGYRVQAGDCCHRHCCPQCKTCVAIPEIVKEKKHKWDVECKDICVPHIKWWWQPCCEPPRCGRVKTIKVLKKHEYECEHCGYKWEVHSCGSGCGAGGCGDACGNGCCTNGAAAPAPEIDVPAPSPADAPAPPPSAQSHLEFPRPAVYYPANK